MYMYGLPQREGSIGMKSCDPPGGNKNICGWG